MSGANKRISAFQHLFTENALGDRTSSAQRESYKRKAIWKIVRIETLQNM